MPCPSETETPRRFVASSSVRRLLQRFGIVIVLVLIGAMLAAATPNLWEQSGSTADRKSNSVEYIVKRLGGKGKVVMMHGYMGQAAQIKRDAGAREVLAKNPGIHLLAEQTAEWDRAKAIALMENWIQAHGDRIDAVFAQNDEMALGALLAIEQAKKKDKIVVVGVDAIADALEAVKQSRLDATVFQDAEGQGRQAVETALKIYRNQPFEKETYIPFLLVTKENAGHYVE